MTKNPMIGQNPVSENPLDIVDAGAADIVAAGRMLLDGFHKFPRRHREPHRIGIGRQFRIAGHHRIVAIPQADRAMRPDIEGGEDVDEAIEIDPTPNTTPAKDPSECVNRREKTTPHAWDIRSTNGLDNSNPALGRRADG